MQAYVFYFCCVCILVELLGHMATLCLVIRGALDCVPKCLYYFAFLLPAYEGSSFLHHSKASPDFFLFNLIVVLISIPLMTRAVE